MIIKFDELCEKLGLSTAFENQEQLHTIEHWCAENILTDLHYDGDTDEKYQHYLTLIKNYLDRFYNQIPLNLLDNLAEFDHKNAIQYAALHGYDRFIAQQTSLSGALLNQNDAAGMTPLHLSAIEGHVHTVNALLAKGANPLIANPASQLPIHSALFMPALHDETSLKNKEAIFRTLHEHAPDSLLHTDSNGDSVFHLMVIYGFTALLKEFLDKNHAGAFIKNHHSLYPIHTAILNNRVDSVTFLQTIDKVPDLTDANGQAALHYAALYGNEELIRQCITAQKDINIRDKSDKTPLMLATEIQNLQNLQILIRQGADTTLVDYRGYSILQYAIITENIDLISWIVENTPIDINQHDTEGTPPLHLARLLNNDVIEELLVSKGAHPNHIQHFIL